MIKRKAKKELEFEDVVPEPKVVPVTFEDYNDKLISFRTTKDMIQQLQKQEKKQKEELDKLFDRITADAKGHRYMEGKDAKGNPLILMRQARKSFSLNLEKAKKFLTSRKLINRVLKTRTEEYLDEKEIETLVQEQELSLNDVKEFTDEKITYAVTFVKAEDKDK